MLSSAAGQGASLESLIFSFSTAGEFFFEPGQAAVLAREIDQLCPGWRCRVVADADRLLRRRVRVLSEDEVDLSERPGSVGILPWHEDFIHGYRWNPKKFFKRIEIPYGRADIKVPWELSRCQHLPTLGMAFAATDDARYAQEVVTQIEDWIACNPPGFGVNWTCAMDVAFRAVNWLWAYRLIAEKYPCTAAFVAQLLASLVRHARHIQSNIETYRFGITNNHTLADYVGLLFLGLLLPELPEARGWADTGREGVLRCMTEQVTEDGVDYENSIPYHRLVLEMLISSYLLADRNGHAFPTEVRLRLERMLDFVHHYTRPDGLAPVVGDCDDGRLVILHDYFSWQPQDHRYLLAIGAETFGRQDFAAAAASAPGAVESAVWMLGRKPRGSPSHGSPGDERRRSRAFPQGGRYVMRHHDHHAVICADEVGTRGLGNHKHNDIFSFELSVSGVAMVIDPGSFVYTPDVEWRNRFRSTRAHNTVVVDGQEQNEFSGVFGMRADAEVSVTGWHGTGTLDVFDGFHTGYQRLPNPATHRRTILFAKESPAWLVVDRVVSTGSVSCDSYLHLAPGGALGGPVDAGSWAIGSLVDALWTHAGGEGQMVARPDASLQFSRGGIDLALIPINAERFAALPDWVSPRYGRRLPALTLHLGARAESAVSFGYLIIGRGRGA